MSVTESILNELLQNVTISTFNAFSLWNTTANATISTTKMVYEFSCSLNLILPYSLSLSFVPCFLILGTVSLFRNGVPAKRGSFI